MNQYPSFKESEIEFLKTHYNTLTVMELSQELHRSKGAIRSKLSRLSLPIETSFARNQRESIRLHAEGKHRCRICNQVKPLTAEHFVRCKGNFRPECKPCFRDINKKRMSKKYESLESVIGFKLQQAKQKHQVEITVEETISIFKKQDGLCFYSGQPMILKKYANDAISIDRKDSSLGYTKDNVVLCCRIVNRMKSDSTIQDFLKWCQFVAETHDSSMVKGLENVNVCPLRAELVDNKNP